MEMPCGDVREKLAEFIESDTVDEMCLAIEQHLARCSDCRVEVDTLRKTIILYHSDSDVAMPVAVTARLQAALAQEYRRPNSSD